MTFLGRPDDFAEPGYFASNLVSIPIRYDVMIASDANARPQSTDIRVELTATKRACAWVRVRRARALSRLPTENHPSREAVRVRYK